ncbi:MAG: hypothetical protein KGH76_01175 [Thaumarchaeota archaeon]|nr:hypothetical protein [Nitrososphaerota archaeon]
MPLQSIAYAAMNFFGFNSNTDEIGVWVNLSTSIFFAATIGVLVYATILQRKAIEIDEYGDLREQHHDLITFQIENSETLEIFERVKIPQKYVGIEDDKIILDKHENLLYQFYIAEFDMYERVWLLKKEKSKLTEYEWMCWIIYLEKMSHHWIFRYAFNQMRTIFDDEFMDHIREKIIERQDRNENVLEEIHEDAKRQYKKEYGKELVFSNRVEYQK